MSHSQHDREKDPEMFHKGHRGGRIFFRDAAPSPNSQKFGGSGALVRFLSLILIKPGGERS